MADKQATREKIIDILIELEHSNSVHKWPKAVDALLALFPREQPSQLEQLPMDCQECKHHHCHYDEDGVQGCSCDFSPLIYTQSRGLPDNCPLKSASQAKPVKGTCTNTENGGSRLWLVTALNNYLTIIKRVLVISPFSPAKSARIRACLNLKTMQRLQVFGC